MPSCKSAWWITSILASGLLFLSLPLAAKTFYGSIVGAITDSTGASIAGVKVTVTNSATAEQRTAETSEDGGYRFVNLIPGTYKVEVSQSGF
jgi:hypothetical protein